MKNKVDVIAELRAHIARKYRTQHAAAKAWGVSQQYLSRVMNGTSLPTPEILAEMGIKRVIEPAKIFYVKGK